MRSRPSSSMSVATPSTARSPGRLARTRTDRHAARAVVGGQRRVGARRGPPAADPGRQVPKDASASTVRSVAVASSIDSDVATGIRRLLGGHGHVQAEADHDHRLGCGDLGEDARQLARCPTSTSLGHFRPAVTPVTAVDRVHHRDPGQPAAASPTRRWARQRRRHRPTARSATAAAPTSSGRACRGPRSGTRRAAPRRRCPHRRRPAPAGRRWWSRSRSTTSTRRHGRRARPGHAQRRGRGSRVGLGLGAFTGSAYG